MDAVKELPKTDPLRAIPVVSPFAEARYDSKGCAQLRMVPPDNPGLKGFIEKKLKIRRPVRVDLDEVGTLFWNMVDGKTRLKEIEKKLRQKCGFKKKECTDAIVGFVQDLMLRGMLMLRLPEHEHSN